MEKIIVPDSFFNQIDKMNKVLAENGAEDKKIDYVQYVNDAIAKAQQSALIRKSDIHKK
jgi:phosphopantetheine adenylyltransferase